MPSVWECLARLPSLPREAHMCPRLLQRGRANGKAALGTDLEAILGFLQPPRHGGLGLLLLALRTVELPPRHASQCTSTNSQCAQAQQQK